ncbi:MAG: hypothetical protein IPO92_11675 [Saprospiraceae bacterium]|nr:hypothetical protein [Saprospiraceae bacterium]
MRSYCRRIYYGLSDAGWQFETHLNGRNAGFDDALMMKFPGSHVFTGKGIDLPAAFLKMSKSPLVSM